MYRGTTPTNRFTTDIDLRGFRIYITYSQNGRELFTKTNEDFEVLESEIVVRLKQEDTLKLSASGGSGRGPSVKMQIRYVTPSGDAGASNIMTASVEDVLKDGEIHYV